MTVDEKLQECAIEQTRRLDVSQMSVWIVGSEVQC